MMACIHWSKTVNNYLKETELLQTRYIFKFGENLFKEAHERCYWLAYINEALNKSSKFTRISENNENIMVQDSWLKRSYLWGTISGWTTNNVAFLWSISETSQCVWELSKVWNNLREWIEYSPLTILFIPEVNWVWLFLNKGFISKYRRNGHLLEVQITPIA